MNFKIQFTNENLQNNSGLILVSKLLDSIRFDEFLNNHIPLKRKSNYSYSDISIFKSFIGLLCLGHSNYEHLDYYKMDKLFKKSLGITDLPSKETYRQRLDHLASQKPMVFRLLTRLNILLLRKHADPNYIIGTNLIPVDFDVTVMDNTGSHKEGVSQSYRPNMKGFAPMMTNIGAQGYLLNHQFRIGSAHSNCSGTYEYILSTMSIARQLCSEKTLLARLDSGNDSDKNIVGLCSLKNSYFIVKHIARGRLVKQTKADLIDYVLKNHSSKEQVAKGTIRYFAEQPCLAGMYDDEGTFVGRRCRKVLSVVELNEDIQTGQPLLIPYRSLHMWRTNLPEKTYNSQSVIQLYKDHGTSEQFHSEFKTDLDIERLPSSKFATNRLILALSQIVFNLLRIIGDKAIVKKLFDSNEKRSRLRIRTVILKLILLPSKLIRKHKQWTISLPRSNPLSSIFNNLYKTF